MSGKKRNASLEYFKHTARGVLIKAYDWYYIEGKVGFLLIKNGRKEKTKNRGSIRITERIFDIGFLENIVGCTVKYEYLGEIVKGVAIRESFSIRVLDLPRDEKTLKNITKKCRKVCALQKGSCLR